MEIYEMQPTPFETASSLEEGQNSIQAPCHQHESNDYADNVHLLPMYNSNETSLQTLPCNSAYTALSAPPIPTNGPVASGGANGQAPSSQVPDTPPAGAPPAGAPPAGAPPAGAPPTGAPPTGAPPTGAPPAGGPADVAADPWISLWLRPLITAGFASITLVLQATIVALSIVSATKQGFLDLPRNDKERPEFTFDVGLSLLWTFLPSLCFQVYTIVYTAIVKAACTRQPYVELAKNNDAGAAPEKSILLDYASWIPPVAIFKALKFGHKMLSMAQATLWIAQLLLGPIASHLLDKATISRNDSVNVIQGSVFDDGAFDVLRGMSLNLDTASAIKLNAAPPLPWTTDNATLLPFDLHTTLHQDQVVNVSAQTQSYSLVLDCEVLQPPNYILAYKASLGSWYFSTSDRGCNFGGQAGILFISKDTGAISSIVQTYRASCDNSAGTSRIIVAAALKDRLADNRFSNVSVVSCLPSYQNNTGMATLSYTGTTNKNLKSFDLIRQTDLSNPLFAPTFEAQVCETSITGSNDEFASKLGDSILRYAKMQDPKAYLSNDDIFVNATKTMLTSAFNVMVQEFLIQPGQPRLVHGTISRPQDRLIVVLPVAYTILAIITLTLVSLAWTCHYTYRHKEAQFEESKGLLGAAVTLYHSNIDVEVEKGKVVTHDGKIGKMVAYDLAHSQECKGWKIKNLPDPRKTVLESTPKARPVR